MAQSTETVIIDAPIEAVRATLTSEAFVVAREQRREAFLGHRYMAHERGYDLEVTQHVPHRLGGHNKHRRQTQTQVARWEGDTLSWTWTPAMDADRHRLGGSFRLEARGEQTAIHITVEMTVDIMLVGEMMARNRIGAYAKAMASVPEDLKKTLARV